MKRFKGINTYLTALVTLLALSLLIAGCSQGEAMDPLPSWNAGPSKKAIIDFVTSVTTKGSPNFVPSVQRIATFDNDGTLWSEKPLVQGMFLLYQLERMAKKDPSIRTKQPFKAAFEHDKKYLHKAGMPAIVELFAATHAGMSQEKFDSTVEEFFAISKHPTLDVPYGQVVFQPMIELLDYLRANGFKTYICSGGGIDFMRGVTAELYGIPPEQVIGSSMKKELQQVDGKWVLSRTGKPNSVNDKEVKPVNIDLHIGQRPLLAMGNVRSGGDIGMLSYSQGREGPSLQLLVNHDDEKREFAYAEADNTSLNEAHEKGWTVVDMKKDWKRIFPE
jgi:phosphoserine phosphatase